jgi:hypothetical protein
MRQIASKLRLKEPRLPDYKSIAGDRAGGRIIAFDKISKIQP